MNKHRQTFIISAGITLFLIMIFMSVTFSLFRPDSIMFSAVFLRTFLTGLILIIPLLAAAGIQSRIYSHRISGNGDAEQLQRKLEGICKLPLQYFAAFLVVLICYSVILKYLAGFLYISSGTVNPLICQAFCWGMLGNASIYHMTEKLNLFYLSSLNITSCPKKLWKNRMTSKTIIVPTFMSFLIFLYAGSMLVLINRKYGSIAELSFTDCIKDLSLLAAYFVITVFQTLSWAGNIRRSFTSIINRMTDLVSAQKDLRQKISISSVDELAIMTSLINQFSEGLAENIRGVQTVEMQLGSFGEDLSASSVESSAAVNQLSSEMNRINDEAKHQHTSVHETSTAVEQISGSIESLNSLISDLTDNVVPASSAIEEMAGNIASLHRSITAMSEHFDELSEISEKGVAVQNEAHEGALTISSKADELQNTNKIISSIAAQTNLLAMNAAIEAAHAGDSGRGFAVVADEIRKLAANAADNSKMIKTAIDEVQQGIQRMVSMTEQSGEAFGRVNGQIESTTAMVSEINASIGEQQEGSRQILASLSKINEITVKVKTGSREISEGNQRILKETIGLGQIADGISGSIGSMTEGITELSAEIQNVAQVAGNTKDSIELIRESINHFQA